MFNFVLSLINKYGEIIRYLIVGVLTTLVSVLSYYVCARIFTIGYMISTVLSWIISVLFAFITNKYFVFQSESGDKNRIFRECIDFFGCRIITLIIEIIIMWLFVDMIHVDDMISKIVVQFIVVVLNYVFSKLFVFQNG